MIGVENLNKNNMEKAQWVIWCIVYTIIINLLYQVCVKLDKLIELCVM